MDPSSDGTKSLSIKQLLSGGWVFLTGVTGFVGGCLLERMLKIDPGPERLFVLVRRRQGVDPRDRLTHILSSPLFSDVPADKLERVQVIPGDITEDGLGLSAADRDLLISKCTHVFHSAASISFAAQLELAIKINLVGSREILGLAKRMRNVQVMVYVSTAYANCTRDMKDLEEKLYPSVIDPAEFIDMVGKLSSRELERRTNEFLGRHPNTYTFTKQMAENLLAKEKGHVPLAIVRPSIVLNTWREPKAGWVYNVNSGACAFIAGVTKGLFRTFQASPDNLLDAIPADMVVSTILASALHATRNPRELHIFHCTSSAVNPINWGRYCEQVTKASRMHPCKDVIWYPKANPRASRLRNDMVLYLFQVLPAHVTDFVVRRLGHASPLLEIQQRYAKGSKYTSYFTSKQWNFTRKNTLMLQDSLPPEERETHPMDPKLIEWDSYFENCVLGMRQYFHKEPATTTTLARSQMKRMERIATVTPFVSFSLFWGLLLLFGYSPMIAALLSVILLLFLIWL